MAVEEEEGGEGLVLCRRADIFLDGQMCKKSVNLRFGHFGRMAHMMEKDETLHPHAVALLGSAAVVTGT